MVSCLGSHRVSWSGNGRSCVVGQLLHWLDGGSSGISTPYLILVYKKEDRKDSETVASL